MIDESIIYRGDSVQSGTASEKMQLKRAKVLREATRLFSWNGYDSTTVAEIAKAAEISFGSVFTYFSSKETLFRMCVLEPLPRVRKLFTFDLGPSEQISAHYLTAMVGQHIKFFSRERLYLQLIQQVLGNPERFPQLFSELDSVGEYMRNQVGKVVELGQRQKILEKSNSRAASTAYSSLLVGMRIFMTDPEESPIWMELKPLALKVLGL